MARPRYFTPTEVSAHNTADDLWVSFLGKVCDLTPLMTQNKGDVLLLPILECAGSDITSWFDPETQDVRTHVDPVTNCVMYYTPRGRFVHVPPNAPCSDWANDFEKPWWKDARYEVGLLTTRARWIRIINTCTSQQLRLEVCSEENVEEILRRYLRYNSHAHSYTCKHDQVSLVFSKTLGENNTPDEVEDLDELRLDHDLFVPILLLHFNDDLTEV